METSIDSASDVRLQALKSLHMILQEKDQNVQVYKNKAQRYEKALQQAECRIAKLMQLHAGAAVTSSGGLPDALSGSSSNSPNVSPVNSSSSRENTLTASGQLGKPGNRGMLTGQYGGRLVTDCGTAAGAVNKELQEEQLLVTRGLPGRSQNSKGQSRTTFDNNDLETDGDEPIRPAGTRAGQSGTAMLPGVSRVLFDNAVKENVKLKKMLQETLQKDGSSVKVFLERQEYADVIKQLRVELAVKHQAVEEMQNWIAMQKAGQSQQLLVQMLELQNKVQLLTKEGKVKTAMVDNCLKENDKLRSENTALKSKQGNSSDQSTVNQLNHKIDGLKKQLEEERQKHHVQIQKLMETAQDNSVTTIPDNDLDSLRAKVCQLEGQLKDEAEAKQLQTEQLLSYKDDYRKVQTDLKQLREKYDKEIGILQGQIKNLQKDKQRMETDFIKEKQKSQSLEGLIVKYAPQYLKSTGGIPVATCAQQVRDQWMTNPTHQPQSILVQDGAPQSMKPKKSGGLKVDGATSSPTKKSSGERAKSSKASPTMERNFMCPRCLRTDFHSVEHFKDHCSKCAQ